MDIIRSGMNVVSAIASSVYGIGRNMLGNVGDVRAKSLSQYSTDLQLRPVFAIEKEILNDEKIDVLMQAGLANYAGFYIVALSIDNTINGVRVGKMVGKYSPNRDAVGSALDLLGDSVASVSREEFKADIPEYDKPTLSTLGFKSGMRSIPSLPEAYLKQVELRTEAVYATREEAQAEADKINAANAKEKAKEAKNKNTVDTPELGEVQRTNKVESSLREEINKLQSLAIGRILTVSISRDKQSSEINMVLKPELKSLRSNLLIDIANLSNKPTSMRDRFIAYFKRGTIASMLDYLVCLDLIQAHRRALVQDTAGYYEKVHDRIVNNKVAALLTGEFSVGTVANTWIISDTTALRLQAAIGGKLDNYAIRNKFMEKSGVMTLIVYNPDHQRVYIYNHGIEDVTDIGINYLIKKSESKSFDMDIFKMLSQGSAPIV
jgi:hypothetical protein|nr:MAG TPA: hypothetical protein [Bacteriophage sp.]